MRKHVLGFTVAKKADAALTKARQMFPKAGATLQSFGSTRCLMVSATTSDTTINQLRSALA